ncbi:MAG TPA: hypothetical protein VIY48_01460 [Candidatus Paceibacterota bacterium]
MTATLPAALAADHEPSGIEISQLLDATLRLSNVVLFNSIGGCTLSTTSATYVNVQGAFQSYSKVGDANESDILILVAVGSWVSAVPNYMSFTIAEGVNTHDTHLSYFNTANHHDTSFGTCRISNMTPNTYAFQLQASVTGGATAHIDTSDTVMMLIMEIPL